MHSVFGESDIDDISARIACNAEEVAGVSSVPSVVSTPVLSIGRVVEVLEAAQVILNASGNQ